MKRLKFNKTQLLAALALAFSLGLATPTMAVFASEGEAGIETRATDNTPAVTSEALYTLIQQAKTEANYAKYEAIYNARAVMAEKPAEATEAQLNNLRQAIVSLNPQAQVGDLDGVALNEFVLNMDGYKAWSAMFDTMAGITAKVGATVTAQAIADKMTPDEIKTAYNSLDAFVNRATGTLADNIVKLSDRIDSYTSFATYRLFVPVLNDAAALAALGADATETERTAALTSLRTDLKKALPQATGIDTMDEAALVKLIQETEGMKEYTDLYNASAFLNDVKVSGKVSASAIETKLTATAQANNYSKLAAAAVAIDNTVMKGLMAYTLPDTSAPVTPDTGIVGLIESGALDLGTLTIIVSVVVAAIAGLGLIGKLYLKHKF